MRKAVVPAVVAMMLLTGALRGQTAPATAPATGPAEKMVLDYRDVAVDTILGDVSVRLGIIVVRARPIPAKVTVVSDKAVGIEEAAVLINEALWPLGFRLYGYRVPDGRFVCPVAEKPTVASPAEMRLWRAPVVPPPVATEEPELVGVSATETMVMRFENETLGSVLDAMGKKFGFVIDPPGMADRRVVLQTPEALHARDALRMVNKCLEPGGHQVKAFVVDDAKGGKRTMLRVVEYTFKERKSPIIDFDYDDTPLETVMADLGKRSGFAIVNSVMGVRVTIHGKLVDEPSGIDIGPLVAQLNEALASKQCLIEATSREAGKGEGKGVLAVMSMEEARHKVLRPPPDFVGPEVTMRDLGDVDPKKLMKLNFDMVTFESFFLDIATTFNVTAMMEKPLPQRVSIKVPNLVDAAESVRLLNVALHSLGYICVVTTENVGTGDIAQRRSVLHIVPKEAAMQYWRTGQFAPSENGAVPATGRDKGRLATTQPDATATSAEEIVQRMRERRQAELEARRKAQEEAGQTATMPGP